MTGPYAAYNGEHLASSGIAAADYSQVTGTNKQFYLVTFNGTLVTTGPGASTGMGIVALNTVTGAGQVKVMVNGPKAGDPAFLWDIGETKVVAGAAITIGQLVMSDSSGRVIPYVDNGVNVPIGECRLPTINGASDVITCFMWPTPAAGGAVEGAIQDGITAQGSGLAAGSPVLVNGWNRVSLSGTTLSAVQMPVSSAGMEVVLIQDGADTVQVFANTAGTDTIDGTTGATGVTADAAKRVTFYCLTAGKWQSNMGVKVT